MLSIDCFKFDADAESSFALNYKFEFIMKTIKLFSFVFILHCGALALFLLQSGCRTTQPPSQSLIQKQKAVKASQVSTASAKVIESTFLGSKSNLDAAFNAGIDTIRPEPTRPQDEPSMSSELGEPSSQESSLSESDPIMYSVKAGDHLWGLARKFGTTVRDLQALNSLNEGSVLSIGQQLRLPAGVSTANTLITSPDQSVQVSASGSSYKVVAGDSLSKIAKRFNTKIDILKKINGLSDDRILVGDNIMLPEVAAGVTSEPNIGSDTSDALIHVVKAGEYLSTIAKRYGLTVDYLLDANSISDPRKLQVGQKLIVGSKPADVPEPNNSPAPTDSGLVNSLTTEETLELNALNVRTQNAESAEPALLNPIQSIAQDLDTLAEPKADATEDSLLDELLESEDEIPVIPVE